LSDEQGNRYTPTHAIKNGRRYRYYTSQAVIRKTQESDVVSRFPAHELECAVVERVLTLLRSPEELIDATRNLALQDAQLPRILAVASQKAKAWEASAAKEKTRFLLAVLQRVVVQRNSLRIELGTDAFLREIAGAKPSQTRGDADTSHIRTITLNCPLTRTHRGKELKLIIGDQATGATSGPALIKAIARARSWYERIINGEAHSFADLAQRDGVSADYVAKLFSCALLAPSSVEALLDQDLRQASASTVRDMMKGILLNWKEQANLV
jgi:hypothetical protein